MSKEYDYKIGYETLQDEWEIHLKRTPRGVSLAKKKSGIYLQLKVQSWLTDKTFKRHYRNKSEL